MAKQKHSPRGARDDDCERRATRGLQSSLQRQRRLVDGDAGAHRRADRGLLQVGALGGGRLGLYQVHEQRLQVVLQLVGVEDGLRSEERRVGTEWVRTCRSRGWRYHLKKKTKLKKK